MTEIVMFHHAQGQTEGFLAFAQELRDAGHVVHAPDYYAGRTFATVDEGVVHRDELGHPELMRRAAEGVATLPSEVVYIGTSLGVVFAQLNAQTRPGALGAVLLYGALPVDTFGAPWPDGVPLQIHGMQGDPWMEWPEAESLAAAVDDSEVFTYPGSGHIFAEVDSPDYDTAAASLLRERVLGFLARIEGETP